MAETIHSEPESKAARPLRRWLIGANVGLQGLLVLALFLIVNYAGFRHFVRRDLSPGRDFSLSEQTSGYLRKLKTNTDLILIYTRDSETIHDARSLLVECRSVKSNRITVDEIDPARDLERAEELKLRHNFTIRGNGILVRIANRVRFITEEEMLVRGFDGDRDHPTLDFRGEESVISAIIALQEQKVRKFYCITGKTGVGARDTSPDLAALNGIGSAQNIEIAPLDLADATAIPEDASGLVILGAHYDLSERELLLLQNYWEGKRAAILVLLDPNGNTPRLNDFLKANGITPRADRVLFAESTSAGPRKEFSVQAKFKRDSPVSKSFSDATTRLGGQTQSLDLRGDTTEMRARHIEVLPLMDAAERYWGETRYNLDELPKIDAEDTKPPVHIAASAERGAVSDERLRLDSSRMVVVGNDNMLNPATRLPVDQDFISSSLNWMLNRLSMVGTITPKRKQFFRLQLDDEQRRRLFQTTVFMLPAIALALGFLIWSHRRA